MKIENLPRGDARPALDFPHFPTRQQAFVWRNWGLVSTERLAAVLSTLAYSGVPYPLASHGLGDLFVFIFFGPVAVCGTYYVQARQLSPSAIWLSLPVGFLITAIIVVNNLRDIATDRKTGKNTLAVRLGVRLTRLEYLLLVVVSFAVTSGLFFSITKPSHS